MVAVRDACHMQLWPTNSRQIWMRVGSDFSLIWKFNTKSERSANVTVIHCYLTTFAASCILSAVGLLQCYYNIWHSVTQLLRVVYRLPSAMGQVELSWPMLTQVHLCVTLRCYMKWLTHRPTYSTFGPIDNRSGRFNRVSLVGGR